MSHPKAPDDQANTLRAGDQSTNTMKIELKEIPREFQRSIEQNLRISRQAAATQRKK